MSAVMALRTKYKETFQEKHGINLGFMSFFVKACHRRPCEAFPLVNSAHFDGERDRLAAELSTTSAWRSAPRRG